MTGAELKLLCTINGIKSYDIANIKGWCHTTMTRYCQPTRVLADDIVKDILETMREIKGGELVTSVDLSKSLPED